jgi:hypothetical protein
MLNMAHILHMNFRTERTTGRCEAGKALTMFTLVTVFLFGIAGLAIESGHGRSLLRITQSAAASVGANSSSGLFRSPVQGILPDR